MAIQIRVNTNTDGGYVGKLFTNFPALLPVRGKIEDGYALLEQAVRCDGKIMCCGNGGSSADSGHIVGELMKGFLSPRSLTAQDKQAFADIEDGQALAARLQKAIVAIDLTAQAALFTAVGNDNGYDMVFAQQVYGYARPGDVLIAMTTSGNSANVVNAAKVARALGVKVLGITGENGGKLADLCDCCICLPSRETYRIQEYTLPLYHAYCAALEQNCMG